MVKISYKKEFLLFIIYQNSFLPKKKLFTPVFLLVILERSDRGIERRRFQVGSKPYLAFNSFLNLQKNSKILKI